MASAYSDYTSLTHACEKHYGNHKHCCCSPSKASPDNIYWERDIVDGQDLYERLQTAEIIMRQPQGLPLRLLIIDSIAHLFRDIGDHPDSSAYVHRTGMLFRISALLRRFADTYNLTVVITNQVSLEQHNTLTEVCFVAAFFLPAAISWVRGTVITNMLHVHLLLYECALGLHAGVRCIYRC